MICDFITDSDIIITDASQECDIKVNHRQSHVISTLFIVILIERVTSRITLIRLRNQL